MSLVIPIDRRGRPSPVRLKRPSERRSSSRSATRALDVLEFFGEVRRPLRAVEIARKLEMHPSTANQLLKTLVDSSHLLFDARTMMYLLSPRLVGLSNWVVQLYGPNERLRTLVRDVYERVGEVATLTTANDLDMQIVELMTPPGHPAERGQRISMFGSASGSAYLSMLGDGEVRRLAQRARIDRESIERILEELVAIRRAGFADGVTGYGEGAQGVSFWSIAVPLPAEISPVRLVLGLAGPRDTVEGNRSEYVACLNDAIHRWLLSEKSVD